MLTATHQPARASEYRAPGGPWDQPSLDELLTAATRAHDGVLVVDGATRFTGPELDDRVARAAAALRAQGVRAGDAVAWQLSNSSAAIVAYRACWRLGAVAVPIHHSFGPADVQRAVDSTAPAVVLGTEAIDALATWSGGPPLTEPFTDGDALAAVLFTSGSSGAPKGVLHTQHTLAYKARSMGAVHGLTSDDAVLMPAPLAHISGLLNGVTVPQATPFRSVLMARWDPAAAIDLIERERVTFMIGPPTFFVGMLQSGAFAPSRVESLRLISSGGAGVSEAFVVDAAERFGCVVKRTYGSTEAPTIATSASGDPTAAARHFDGRAIGGAELRADDTGELLVRGPEVCVGYLDARHNDAFTDDGWFRTGDLATIDAEGWLTIVGRLKDVIIRGGENISAAEVENVLERHPAVAHAVAVGYPDELMGERVCAFVVANGPFDLDICREWFGEQGIARFKTPERVVTIDAIPVLSTGKPDREQLRTRAASRSGAHGDA